MYYKDLSHADFLSHLPTSFLLHAPINQNQLWGYCSLKKIQFVRIWQKIQSYFL